MNKKAIWAIIGLMSAAVIGVVWLQMDLIRTAIKVNEEEFDKNVYSALSEVAASLVYEQRRQAFRMWGNGFVTNYMERGEEMGPLPEHPSGLSLPLQTSGKDMLDQLLKELAGVCTCKNCLSDPSNPYRQLLTFYTQSMPSLPLEERINPRHLYTLLSQELANKGIDTEFNYGVYSRKKKSFVVFNDHYVVEDAQPKEVLPGYRTIFNSRYRVHLFPEEMPSPGLLMIHFPSRGSFLWRSLWLNFLGSMLFTGIILFSFGYTIYVIFRQKKLSEMKTDFINNMTHEFKTPIATISLAVDSINSPLVAPDEDKVRRFAGIIQQENQRMNNQVEKVLQMALLDRKDFSLKYTRVDLHELIRQAAENITLQVEKKAGNVQLDLQAAQPMVEADLTHVSNILNNLLDNANKYSPEEPEITIRTRDHRKGVEVAVQDQGIGMSKEARKQIFDKFYRVPTGNRHDVKGFGLGLSYVKAMMIAHKGYIEVKSEPGKGSVFVLFFPHRQES